MAREVLRHYMTPEEAELGRAQLEAANIDAWVIGGEGSRMIPGAGAREGVALEVEEADAERAKELLAAEPQIAESVRAAHPELTKSDDAPTPPAEAAATRALRASLIGVFLCPVLLHLYSLWLLRGVFAEWASLPDSSKRTAIAATVLDVIAIALAIWGVFSVSAGGVSHGYSR